MTTKFRNSIEIKTPSCWELVASDVIDEFLSDFTERDGLTRELNDYEVDEEYSFEFVYTEKGMLLYERLVERLDNLGHKIFPNECFSYSPTRINIL